MDRRQINRWKTSTTVALLIFLIEAVVPLGFPSHELEYDIILRGGRVFDGAGNPWVHADGAIKDGRIALVGSRLRISAKREIDLDGLYVMPGIIDVHSHPERVGAWCYLGAHTAEPAD